MEIEREVGRVRERVSEEGREGGSLDSGRDEESERYIDK